MRRTDKVTVARLLLLLLVWIACGAVADAAPPIRLAVTDLTYEEQVRDQFRVAVTESRTRQRDSFERGSYQDHQATTHVVSGTQSYIIRGELHKFVADIKGELIKLGYQLVQGRPAKSKEQDKLFDILARVKQGVYQGASHVLFGVINSIEFREESNPVDQSARPTWSHSLSLELMAEFSLIDARSHAVIASFSAMGEGSDTRLVNNPQAVTVPSRGKVVSETSVSLGQDVAQKLQEQLAPDLGR
ncbi:MAG: penicillin-binding protein activator LpoB [Magnetococcales bacterium]|nr:penicillin-binding protein activator LpoB [Magnetococcales bacterium]